MVFWGFGLYHIVFQEYISISEELSSSIFRVKVSQDQPANQAKS